MEKIPLRRSSRVAAAVEESRMSSGEIPVFRPTVAQFQDFPGFIEEIERQGGHHVGLAKIIPPAGWKPRKNGYGDIKEFNIPSPSEQKFEGSRGTYTLYNVEKKPMTVENFERLTRLPKYCTPAHADMVDLERKYWQNVSFAPPIYGADVSGTIYDPDVKEFNMNHLGTILDLVKTDMGTIIQGVNTAYLYWGMWKSTFPWHTEDMDLYSINYLHYGAAKFWYVVPPEQSAKFERLVQNFFPADYRECPAFLRHKMSVVSPKLLHQHGIDVKKIAQNAGEFMITFPMAYHAGFNTGYNCAESTNFATRRWIDFGKTARPCSCRSESVSIEMNRFVEKYQTKEQLAEYQKQYGKQRSMGQTATSTVNLVSKRQSIARKRNSGGLRGSKAPKRGKLGTTEDDADLIAGGNDQPGSSGSAASSAADSVVKQMDMDDWMIDYKLDVAALWKEKENNFQAEVKFNKEQGRFEPHCAVCQYFVSRCLTTRVDVIPKRSRRLVTNRFFTKDTDETSAANNATAEHSQERLLTCHTCHVTVHSSCYGVSTAVSDVSKWKCQRCTKGPSAASCELCCLRGGALVSTTDGYWCHVVCAIMCSDATFSKREMGMQVALTQMPNANEAVDGRRQIVSSIGPCLYCKKEVGSMVSCGKRELPSCKRIFHPTCCFATGGNIELVNGSYLFNPVCSGHNAPNNSGGLADPEEGEEVFAARSDGNSYKATVQRITTAVYCVVIFDDGSVSDNVAPGDIEDCDCRGPCKGAHLSGARVKVRWDDGELYEAYFRRAFVAPAYHVIFVGEEGEVQIRRDEFRRDTAEDLARIV